VLPKTMLPETLLPQALLPGSSALLQWQWQLATAAC
jgi:hypothetical protein